MTKDDVIRLAMNSGLPSKEAAQYQMWWLEAFAKLVAEHEREACAKTVEAIETYEKIEKACFKFAAKTIRARGEK